VTGEKMMSILDDTLEILIREFGADVVGPAFVRAVSRVDGDVASKGWKSKLTRMEAERDAASVQLLE